MNLAWSITGKQHTCSWWEKAGAILPCVYMAGLISAIWKQHTFFFFNNTCSWWEKAGTILPYVSMAELLFFFLDRDPLYNTGADTPSFEYVDI